VTLFIFLTPWKQARAMRADMPHMYLICLAKGIAMYTLLFLIVTYDTLLFIILMLQELRELTRCGICRLIEMGYTDEFRTLWQISEAVAPWLLLRPFLGEERLRSERNATCHHNNTTAGNATW
jgi:hypothetical protein